MNKLGNLPAMTPFSEKRKGKKNTGWGKNSAHREKKRDLRLNFLQKRPILKKHHQFLGFPHRVFKMEKDFNVPFESISIFGKAEFIEEDLYYIF
jgi:hypothetical protein